MGVTGACPWLHRETSQVSQEPWPPLSQQLLEYPLTYDNWVRSSAGEGVECSQVPWGPHAWLYPGALRLNAISEPLGQQLGSQASLLGDSLGSFGLVEHWAGRLVSDHSQGKLDSLGA